VSPRVASLVPAATEIAFALGCGSELVGVSHACRRPPGIPPLPVLTRSRIAAGLGEREVDARVRELAAAGEDLYEVDVEALGRAAPEVLLVQGLCDVCAVGPDGVRAALEQAGLDARVVVLRGDSLAGIADDALEIGEALGRAPAGRALARQFDERLAAVGDRVAGLRRRRVVALEWLDPPFAAGHWVPQMVRLAGAEEVLGEVGKRSRRVDWEAVERAAPEVLCVVPCGCDLDRARAAWRAARERLAAAGSPLVALEALALDADALVSRPGPGLARGVEVLAALLHPEARLPEPLAHEAARA
jgi:iron complex transport system substrate-binding protein